MRWILAVLVFLGSAGCGDDQQHDAAVELYNRTADHASWPFAPDYPGRRPSFTAHSDEVEIRVNPTLAGALHGGSIKEWPVGSIVVKDGYRIRGSRSLTAIMEKRADGWFFAEYDDEGNPKYSGRPSICVDCHDNRATYSDWLYSVTLPR